MAEEMRLHFEHITQEHLKDGLSPDEAFYAAQRQFGRMDQFQEECRDGMTWRVVNELGRDFRFAGRLLRKNVGFTVAALLTLALCIGANTAIFSMVYGLLLKPLPYPEPERIVEINNVFNSKTMASNLVQYLDYKTHAVSYEAIGLWRLKTFTVGGVDSTERVNSASCTAEMFDILGVQPLMGTFFSSENSKPGNEHVVVLTESYWAAHFNRDPGGAGKIASG